MAVEYIGDNNPDGMSVGQSSASLVSFFGATPVVRPSGSGQASVSTAAITSVSTAAITSVSTVAVTTAAGIYGFTTAAAGDGVIAGVNALITRAGVLTTAANALVTQAAALTALGNQLRSDLSSASLNLIKGGS